MTSERRQQLLSLLCSIRREKAEKIKILDKQNRVILAGVFLQYVLYVYCEEGRVRAADNMVVNGECQATDLDFDIKLFETNNLSILNCGSDENFVRWCRTFVYAIAQDGKPYLPNYPEVQFNLSHSRDWVVVALGDEVVGVDVEKRVAADRCKAVAARCFHEDENKVLKRCEGVELEQRFLRYWTCKEAYVKYLGTGLKTPLNQFCISDDYTCVQNIQGKKTNTKLQTKSLDEEYELAICVTKREE